MWPYVHDESGTLDLVLGGRSIARFGDGEINLCFGGLCVTQAASGYIAARLRRVISAPGDCLIGIPHMRGPKDFWLQYRRKEIMDLFGPDRMYYSAFITRPDSAPWINRPEYWAKLRRLWSGRDVTLVRGSDKSLTAKTIPEARRVSEIIAPTHEAFDDYVHIRRMVLETNPSIVLLCLGPTATILAHDLCEVGIHAVDLGHVGMFLRKHDAGQPMKVTDADRAIDARLKRKGKLT